MIARARQEGFAVRTEEQLLLCCARTHLDEPARQRIAKLLAGPIDWKYLVQLAEHHGTAMLTHRNLSAEFSAAVPAEFAAQLRELYDENAVRTRSITRELIAVLTLFEARGIRALAWKGPTLAISIYGDLALRLFWDLDILVSETDVESGAEILRARGYYLHEDSATRTADRDKHEMQFLRKAPPGTLPSMFSVDVQWVIAQRKYIRRMTLEGFWDRRRLVSIDGLAVATLSTDDLLLMLCVHGIKHHWSHLRWVCDVAGILAADPGAPGLDWAGMLRTAGELRCQRVFLLGVYVAADLLGAPLPDLIREQLRDRPVIRSLATHVKNWMFRTTRPQRTVRELLSFRIRSRDHLRDNLDHIKDWLRPQTA